MRQVKIFEGFFATEDDLEKQANKVFQEIDEKGYKIVDTQYCVSKDGFVKSIVIEYEI